MSGAQPANKPNLVTRAGSELCESSCPSTPGDEELPDCHSRRSRSNLIPLSRLLAAMNPRRRQSTHVYDYHAAPTEDLSDAGQKHEFLEARSWRRSRKMRILKRTALYLPVMVLAFFGLLHILMVILGRKSLFWDIDQYEQYLPNWGTPGHVGAGLSQYPTDATRNILPIPCHSHNDYWRRVPLFDAIHAGCTSVEADVWLFKDRSDELFVGHGTASLTPDRTLASLYVNPLVDLLDKMNTKTEFSNTKGHGVFDEVPEQTLVLLIDFKTNSHELFPRVREQLEPLRKKGYLTYWDGEEVHSRAITVVGTGNTPFDLVVENKEYRDIFFDAPLDEMWEDPSEGKDGASAVSESRVKGRGQGKTGTGSVSPNDFNITNSYYASTSLESHIGYPWTGKLSPKQMNLLRGQIKGAKRRGLRSRYWETPSWPTSLRNHIWQMLIEEGVDMLNVDDLRAASKLDWDIVRHDWIDA